MRKSVMVVMVSHRHEAAKTVQSILTGWGCNIRTRLGIHQGVLEDCTETGLIILDLVGEEERLQELERKLNLVKGVTARMLQLELED